MSVEKFVDAELSKALGNLRDASREVLSDEDRKALEDRATKFFQLKKLTGVPKEILTAIEEIDNKIDALKARIATLQEEMDE